MYICILCTCICVQCIYVHVYNVYVFNVYVYNVLVYTVTCTMYITSYTAVYPAIRCGTPGSDLVHPEAEG